MAKSKKSSPIVQERNYILVSGRRHDEVVLTEHQAREFADKWKDFLGLRDWIVFLYIKRAEDMGLRGVQGEVRGYEEKQLITINLRDPVDFAHTYLPQNMEKTIIHELLHILLYPLNIGKKLSMEEERCIEKLSHAYYEMSQGRGPI